MENVEIDEERSDCENSTSTEITKASDIREVSESESLETSSSCMTATDSDSDLNSVFSFKYEADDEGVTITKPSEIREVSESESLVTSNSELTIPFKYDADDEKDPVTITKASDIRTVSESGCLKIFRSELTSTDSVISLKYDADDEKDPVTDFEGWTQDDLTTSTSSIYITPDEYADETQLPVLDPKPLKYLNVQRFEYDTKIWLHSKKVVRIKRKHRRRAFTIPTDDTSDSETRPSTSSVTYTIHVYRPSAKDKKHKSKIRRFLGRVFRVFKCCFGS